MLQPFESPTQQNETDESQPQPQPHFIASLQRRGDKRKLEPTLWTSQQGGFFRSFLLL